MKSRTWGSTSRHRDHDAGQNQGWDKATRATRAPRPLSNLLGYGFQLPYLPGWSVGFPAPSRL